MGGMLRAVQRILGAFEEDLCLLGELRHDDARGVRIQVAADDAFGKSRPIRILEVIEERLNVLRQLLAQSLYTFLIPSDGYARATDRFERPIGMLAHGLRAQQLF